MSPKHDFEAIDHFEAEERFFDRWRDPVGHAAAEAEMNRKKEFEFPNGQSVYCYSSEHRRNKAVASHGGKSQKKQSCAQGSGTVWH